MDVSNSSTSGILRVEWPPRMERLEKASYKKQKPKFKEKIGLRPQERRTFQTGVLSLTKLMKAERFRE